MADYYVQWSFEVRLDSPEETEWLNSLFRGIVEASNLEGEAFDVKSDELETEFGLSMVKVIEEAGSDTVDFRCAFDHDPNNRRAFFYSDESGRLEAAAEVTRAFLNRWHQDRSVSVGWSESCSKMRPDAFGGGAVFITATSVEFFHVAEWLNKKTKTFDRKKGKQ